MKKSIFLGSGVSLVCLLGISSAVFLNDPQEQESSEKNIENEEVKQSYVQ